MHGRWRSLVALTLARAAMAFQFQSVAAVAPLLTHDLGLDKAQLGWLIGLYLLPGIAFALPGGLLGRRFGDKRLVLVGLALMGLGGIWFANADSFAAANAARILSGIGAVMLNVLMTKMVADWFDGKERLLAMSILINAWPVGIGIALLVVPRLGEMGGWPWGIGSTAVFAAIGFAIVGVFYRSPALLAYRPVGSLGLGGISPREWQLLLIASLPWMLYNAAFQVVVSFLPSFFVESGLGITRAGSLVALNAVLFVVGVQMGGLLPMRARRHDLGCLLAIGAWCVSLLMLATGSAPTLWIVVGGLLGGIPAATLVSLPAEFLRPEHRGGGMGVFYTIYYVGCSILPAIAGALYDSFGGQAALWMAAAMALCCAPAIRLFRRAITSETTPSPDFPDPTGS